MNNTSSHRTHFGRPTQGLLLILLASSLAGCFQATTARDIRNEYAGRGYAQSLAAAQATRSLARELLDKDSPTTIRTRLEDGFTSALQAARLDDDGNPLQDPTLLQQRTVRAVLWYEGERRGLQDWYTTELRKINALGSLIEGTGEAALHTNRMANGELKVTEDALRSAVTNHLPEIAGETLKAYLDTRSATDVATTPPTPSTPLP